ncbi:MAG: calcium/sodium antiporter [Bryobacterales bacterium]|nr:calcium/sodium antiporter [Bryobacterales bacterium]
MKGADLLVDGASSIAKRLRVPGIVIGLTIVAFGTSLPELMVSVIAAMEGNSDIAIGNVIGSNIANILLILGIAAIIYPVTAKRNTVLKEIPFSLLAALVTGVMANDLLLDKAPASFIGRGDGLILVAFFVIFLYYIFGVVESEPPEASADILLFSHAGSAARIAAGLTALAVGGQWIVSGAVQIAQSLGVSESLIGLTVVAVGTSLPELATSAMAAYKRRSDIAIGNVVGSNIFNVFWVLGLSAIIRPLPFQAAGNIDVLVAAVASLILFVAMYIGKRHVLERWQGGAMVAGYLGYMIFVVSRG